jgi:hypothetical protein
MFSRYHPSSARIRCLVLYLPMIESSMILFNLPSNSDHRWLPVIKDSFPSARYFLTSDNGWIDYYSSNSVALAVHSIRHQVDTVDRNVLASGMEAPGLHVRALWVIAGLISVELAYLAPHGYEGKSSLYLGCAPKLPLEALV